MNSIGIIICYFGKWPPWFPLFLKSCIYNNKIDWLFFSDYDLPEQSRNIKPCHLSKNQFNKLASKRLGFEINIKDPYKLCDFKPAYGNIFEDYLRRYDFWGYSDIDLIYGNIPGFITSDILKQYDVISTYSSFLSGPLTIYRNIKDINTLYSHAVNYREVYQNPEYLGFDENIGRKTYSGTSLKKLALMAPFLVYYLKFVKSRFVGWKELKYQFQWYFKKLEVRPENLLDMTDIIWYLSKKKRIKVYFKELLLSDRYFERTGNKNWKVLYAKGELIENKTQEKIMGFHFIDQKKNHSFNVPSTRLLEGRFSMSKKGFGYE